MENSVFWNPGMKLDTLEQIVIEKAYKFYNRNKTATANALGISIRTLDNKLEKYEMTAIEEAARDESRKQQRDEQLARARGVHTGQFDTAASPRFDPRTPFRDTIEARLCMEPVANATEKSQVPMQERAEVQKVLPRPNTSGGPNRRRG